MTRQLAFRELGIPPQKHLDIITEVFRPEPNRIKPIDVCCGLGFGKTALLIQIAALDLNRSPGTRLLFFEPDWDRCRTIFLAEWMRLIPPDLYTHHRGLSAIEWYNGAWLYYRPRVVTGDIELNRDKRRGIEVTGVLDDETAIKFDLEFYQNTFARIRRQSDVRYYITATTPKVGAYGRLLQLPGHTVFKGRTADNTYLPEGYEEQQRANMSRQQALRELDGEMIALEGRIWKDAIVSATIPEDAHWPKGNIDPWLRCFDPSKPYWLFCDLGSATGAYVAVQRRDSRGRFDDDVWVVIAEYCPAYYADAVSAFQKFDAMFGSPAAVVAGKDVNTRDKGDGRTVSYFASQIWPGVRIIPMSEREEDKQIYYNKMLYLVCDGQGHRRLTVAKDLVVLDDSSKRGVREMFQEDQMPPIEKRRDSDILPKGSQYPLCHVRDALLMGTGAVMCQPRWYRTDEFAA